MVNDVSGPPGKPVGAEAPRSGWQTIAGTESVVKMVDALLSLPPKREFNQSELAEFADISRKSVHTHLPRLKDIGIITEVPESTPTRYRFDTDSEVAKQLIKLDGAVNNAKEQPPA
ncbi:winged helix-turn-helix domain-containing protein (plasmid) [Haloarcula salina]|uniref:winged helix-turn-helix domain-containing protein n=1 Tax=Haloarcula salina TaxID=1429914 RepID=UPI003C6FEF55